MKYLRIIVLITLLLSLFGCSDQRTSNPLDESEDQPIAQASLNRLTVYQIEKTSLEVAELLRAGDFESAEKIISELRTQEEQRGHSVIFVFAAEAQKGQTENLNIAPRDMLN